jgi:hypothetical protein
MKSRWGDVIIFQIKIGFPIMIRPYHVTPSGFLNGIVLGFYYHVIPSGFHCIPNSGFVPQTINLLIA